MKKKALTITIPDHVYAELEKRAKEIGVSIASIIIEILYKETTAKQ
jgi:predicted CopG family antitoxin